MLTAEFQEETGLLPGFTSNVPAHHVLEVLPNDLMVPYRFPVQ
jgi:hypothetical protein